MLSNPSRRLAASLDTSSSRGLAPVAPAAGVCPYTEGVIGRCWHRLAMDASATTSAGLGCILWKAT
jgi:hypothetical protein